KLHYRAGVRDGFSQYFVINPQLEYPATTLRLLGRKLGLTEPGRVEPAFHRALETPGTLFAVIAKVGDKVAPRLSTRLPRALLPDVLLDFEGAGYITVPVRLALEEANRTVEAGDWAYLSIDPETTDAVSLDFERPVLSEGLAPRYLKVRPRAGTIERSAYYRVLDLWTPTEIVAATASSVAEPEAYYETHHPEILAALGHTYQTGTLSEDAAEHNRALVERAGIEPGAFVVDAGCGSGGPACDLLEAVPGTTLLGLTLSSSQAAEATALAARRGLSDRARFEVGDYSALPRADASVDQIVFFESLGYSAKASLPLVEAFRVLRPGGRLYIKDVMRKPQLTPEEMLELAEFTNLYGYFPLTPADLKGLTLEAGFSEVELRPFGPEMTSKPFHAAMFAQAQPTPFG
ncbi:class I SAM-dependent methyltransferase, partial [bacterium]